MNRGCSDRRGPDEYSANLARRQCPLGTPSVRQRKLRGVPWTTLAIIVIVLLMPRLSSAKERVDPLRVLAIVPSHYPHRAAEHPFLHLTVMESLAPLRFTLMEEQPPKTRPRG